MNPETPQDAVASPCTNQCKLVDDMTFCATCYRTIEEIYVWGQITDTERRSILEAVQGRRDGKQEGRP
jgi:uncharacterized protein